MHNASHTHMVAEREPRDLWPIAPHAACCDDIAGALGGVLQLASQVETCHRNELARGLRSG